MTSQRVDTLLASSILVFLILSYISQVTTTPTSLDSDREGTEDDIDWLLQPVSLTSDNQNNDDIRLDAIKKDFPVTPIARKLKETPKERKLKKTSTERKLKKPRKAKAGKLNKIPKVKKRIKTCIYKGKNYHRGEATYTLPVNSQDTFPLPGISHCRIWTCYMDNLHIWDAKCEDSNGTCHDGGSKWWDKDCVHHSCGKGLQITSNKGCKDSSGKCHEVGSEWLEKDCGSLVCGNDYNIISNKMCHYNGTCYRAESRWIDYNKCDHYQCIMKNKQFINQIVYPAAYTCKTAIKYKPGSVESERKVVCGCPETYELFPESNNLTSFYYLLPL